MKRFVFSGVTQADLAEAIELHGWLSECLETHKNASTIHRVPSEQVAQYTMKLAGLIKAAQEATASPAPLSATPERPPATLGAPAAPVAAPHPHPAVPAPHLAPSHPHPADPAAADPHRSAQHSPDVALGTALGGQTMSSQATAQDVRRSNKSPAAKAPRKDREPSKHSRDNADDVSAVPKKRSAKKVVN